MLAAFALIYWEITAFEVTRANNVLTREAKLLAALPTDTLIKHIQFLQDEDLQFVVSGVGLFDSAHHEIAGNLHQWPGGLLVDGTVQRVRRTRFNLPMRSIGTTLPNGTFLVLSRKGGDLQELRDIVLQALGICAVPAMLFSLLGGGWVSHRALRRVGVMHVSVERIMDGNLHERLPSDGGYDELERLASSVNRMLDRISHLVEEIKGVGDNIAHDLRTPLTRIRTRLERSRKGAQNVDAINGIIGSTISDLDQCLGIITALLRIGEIETGRRRAAFGLVDLAAIAANILDLYEPLANDKQVALRFNINTPSTMVHGDHDLLIETVANLIDNAIKFTPSGGHVALDVGTCEKGPFFRVSDDGPGIASMERETVLHRFYRSDKSRLLPGHGLGLSLVVAIMRLHDANMIISDGQPGAIFHLQFPSVKI